MKWILGLILLCLVGCVSQAERMRQQQYEEQQYQAHLAGRCRGFGFTPGTLGFAQCMLQLDQANEQRRTALGAALLDSGMLNQRQAPIQQPILTSPPTPKRPTQTNCYTDTFGYTRCTTY